MGDVPGHIELDRKEDMRRELTELFNGMMSALFEQKGAALDISILASDEAQGFIGKHASALDSSFSQVKMSDSMRRRLQRSDYIFSGLKAFHELNEAFPSLIDENGNRKPFERFLNDVQKIDATYNRDYLRAEYNFVQSSAEMAAKWEQYAEDGDRYNLQYRTAGDGKVRPEHAALNGVTLPMSDPFWEEYYPPNGWNCRCTVVQVRRSKYPATPHEEAMALGEEALGRDTKGIFHFNPGKERKSVPDYNPYTIRRCRDCDIAQGKTKLARQFVPDNELCAACRFIRSCADSQCDRNIRPYKNNLIQEVEKRNENYNNLQTGNYYLNRKAFKRAIGHAWNIEEAELYKDVNKHIGELSFVRESPLGEGKNMTDERDIANIEKKQERHVTSYNIYEWEYRGETYTVKTEVYKERSETVYCIYKKKE